MAASEIKNAFEETISITFGDQAENHHGMQIIGKLADEGFNKQDLVLASEAFQKSGHKCELINLHSLLPPDHFQNPDLAAYLLIIRGGISALMKDKDGLSNLLEEQMNLECDSKAKMRGRVVNKRARHNLCFGEISQSADFPNGKGTIIAFGEVPNLLEIRLNLPKFVGSKGKMLCAELNRYFDLENCGIGFHGDAERKKVVCLRIGGSMPLDFQWFHQCDPVGKRFSSTLHHGDVYVMSEKATGFDWKRRSQYTLRHAAGCKKYRTIKSRKKRTAKRRKLN